MRKKMGHTAVSATLASSTKLYIWQHGAREKSFCFAIFNRIVDTKTNIMQMETNIFNIGQKRNHNR